MATALVILDRRMHRRKRRVLVLLAGVVLLSLADLAITLTHLRTTGMMEANPIAALLIESTQSVWALASFKLFTLAVCVSVLFVLRRRFEGEVAAWIAVVILAGMSVQWHAYSSHFDDPHEVMMAQAGDYGDGWLMLE
jgi:hypothetical protein